MFTIHATKKLLDRLGQPVVDPVEEPSTRLGNWYAKPLMWRPQVALFVNERTLLPVFMPLAPAKSLGYWFPEQVGLVLEAIGVSDEFVRLEVEAMAEVVFAKTASRSVLGAMNDFAYLAGFLREAGHSDDLVALSVMLADTPCSLLYSGHVRIVKFSRWSRRRRSRPRTESRPIRFDPIQLRASS